MLDVNTAIKTETKAENETDFNDNNPKVDAKIDIIKETLPIYDSNIGKDETMDLPEGMLDAQIDSMMREWNARVYLNYDGTNCFSTGENKSNCRAVPTFSRPKNTTPVLR